MNFFGALLVMRVTYYYASHQWEGKTLFLKNVVFFREEPCGLVALIVNLVAQFGPTDLG